jgi:hypothetical protein
MVVWAWSLPAHLAALAGAHTAYEEADSGLVFMHADDVAATVSLAMTAAATASFAAAGRIPRVARSMGRTSPSGLRAR